MFHIFLISKKITKEKLNKKSIYVKQQLFLLLFLNSCNTSNVRSDFSKIESIEPPILIDIRYSGSDNFLGRTVKGYESPKNILTNEAIDALTIIQKILSKNGLGLKLYDGYRPQKSVNDFIYWSKKTSDTLTKQKYYPDEIKDSLIVKGYIAEKSSHSRGSTVDVTIIYTDSVNYGKELDMGGGWDFFGIKSWIDNDSITDLQKKNRNYLQNIMNQNGFRSYSKEWWHFTLINEPYPNTYFDF